MTTRTADTGPLRPPLSPPPPSLLSDDPRLELTLSDYAALNAHENIVIELVLPRDQQPQDSGFITAIRVACTEDRATWLVWMRGTGVRSYLAHRTWREGPITIWHPGVALARAIAAQGGSEYRRLSVRELSPAAV